MKQFVLFLLTCAYLLCSYTLAQPRIAYVTPDAQLATITADGEDMRQLTQGDAVHQFPAFSPDGEQIAVIGRDAEGGFITVYSDEANASGEELYRDAAQSPFYLYWSPDSARVAFLANQPGGIGLNIANTTQTGEIQSELLSSGSPYYWQWREDAQEMLIHADTGEGSRVGFITLEDDTLEPNLADFGTFQAPGISADETYIAYATGNRLRDDRRVIVESVEPDQGTKREVPHVGVAALSWSPVANQLAIQSPAEDAARFFGPIRLLDADTGDLEPLTDKRALAFFWSPDGRYIAYLSAANTSNDQLATADALRVSNSMPVQDRRLLLDLNLIDIESREERLLSSFAPSPQFVGQFLPFFDQYALSHNVWSPESDALVFSAVNEGSPQVTVFDLDGNATPIAEGDMGFWNVR